MVALRGRDIDAYLAKPDAGRPIALLYGPDAGLIRERADALIATAVDDPSDPFSLVRIDGRLHLQPVEACRHVPRQAAGEDARDRSGRDVSGLDQCVLEATIWKYRLSQFLPRQALHGAGSQHVRRYGPGSALPPMLERDRF